MPTLCMLFLSLSVLSLLLLLQMALAMCTVLSTTLTRVPNGVLRSKFVGTVQLLSAVVEQHREQVRVCACECVSLCAHEPLQLHSSSGHLSAARTHTWWCCRPSPHPCTLLFCSDLLCLSSILLTPSPIPRQAPACKGALQCLGQVLSAVEPGAWPSASVSFQLLLSFITDARPKIRKRATSSVTEVLAAVQGCPANLAAASEAVLARELVLLVLLGVSAWMRLVGCCELQRTVESNLVLLVGSQACDCGCNVCRVVPEQWQPWLQQQSTCTLTIALFLILLCIYHHLLIYLPA